MSNVASIYSAVASVAVSGVSNVKSLSALPATVAPADIPVRLLLPFGAGDNEGNMIEFMDAYPNAFIEWKLVDLALFRPVAEGEGIHTIASTIVVYGGEYISTFIAHRYLDTAHLLEVRGATAKPGIIEYPSQSGKYYHGVLCTLTVREPIINR